MLAGTRGYSSSFVFRIRDVQSSVDPAVRALGQACLEHEVPITMVAEMFGVTRATVYNWLTGETAPRGRTTCSYQKSLKSCASLSDFIRRGGGETCRLFLFSYTVKLYD